MICRSTVNCSLKSHSFWQIEVVRRTVAVCPGVLGGLYLDELPVGQLMNGPDALSRLIFQVFAVLFAVERWVTGTLCEYACGEKQMSTSVNARA